jgi:5-methylthioadenosine/S-adenosylhomocysteine deaminase
MESPAEQFRDMPVTPSTPYFADAGGQGGCRCPGCMPASASAPTASSPPAEALHLPDRSAARAALPTPEWVGRLNAAGERRRLLIRGACVVSMDPAVPDLPRGDILVEGSRIAAIAPRIDADCETVDARGMIACPGFIDTHRHCWQNVFRRFAPNILWLKYRETSDQAALVYSPEDVLIGNLLTCLGAIDSGVTTLLDWSHISNSPDHSDAAIEGLQRSGIRAVYGYGQSRCNHPDSQYPQDIRRLRRDVLPSDDALVTLCLAADIDRYQHWPIARELGLRITAHAARRPELMAEIHRHGLMKDDTTYIHCTALDDLAWNHIRDSGATLSIATTSVAQLGVAGGLPPIQRALDLGLRPSLSIDVEVSLPGDMFTQMRAMLALQRSAANERRMRGDGRDVPCLSVRDVLGFATVEGARALGMQHRIGSLAPGKQADLILIEAGTINTLPLNNAIGTIVSGADGRNVSTVMIAGRLAKWAGQLLDFDVGHIRQLAEAARDRVVEKSGLQAPLFGDGY